MDYYFTSLKYFIFLASPFSTVILLNDQQFWPAVTQRIFEVIALDQKGVQMETYNVCLRKDYWHFLTLYPLSVNHCYLYNNFWFWKTAKTSPGEKSKILFYSQISHSTMYQSTSISPFFCRNLFTFLKPLSLCLLECSVTRNSLCNLRFFLICPVFLTLMTLLPLCSLK